MAGRDEGQETDTHAQERWACLGSEGDSLLQGEHLLLLVLVVVHLGTVGQLLVPGLDHNVGQKGHGKVTDIHPHLHTLFNWHSLCSMCLCCTCSSWNCWKDSELVLLPCQTDTTNLQLMAGVNPVRKCWVTMLRMYLTLSKKEADKLRYYDKLAQYKYSLREFWTDTTQTTVVLYQKVCVSYSTEEYIQHQNV